MMTFLVNIKDNRQLLFRLAQREVLGRYRGSIIGIGWSLLTPISMLSVYAFIFSQVFKSRWGTLQESGPAGFAINLFAGLIVFNFFSECTTRAPTLITSNPNYVKKVVFPLETLGSAAVCSAFFHAIISLGLLLLFQAISIQRFPASIFMIPLVWLPLVTGTLGITWLLSSLGVFVRDTSQVVGVLLNMTMFLSPIFYPISALPEKAQHLLGLNPIAVIIEETRRVLVEGNMPSRDYIIAGSITGVLFCEISFRVFLKSKRAFADVI